MFKNTYYISAKIREARYNKINLDIVLSSIFKAIIDIIVRYSFRYNIKIVVSRM